jgi:hypothetical protein
MKTIKKILLGVYWIQVFIVFPSFFGSMCREEQSVWVWQEYITAFQRHGANDALLAVYLYLIFYSSLFSIPYIILLGILWLVYMRDPSNKAVINISEIKLGIAFISLACFFTLFLFLKGIVEFTRSSPTEVLVSSSSTLGNWTTWLFIPWCIVCFFLLFFGFSYLKEERNKTFIKVQHDRRIFCRCPSCGHEYFFSATDLKNKNIVMPPYFEV